MRGRSNIQWVAALALACGSLALSTTISSAMDESVTAKAAPKIAPNPKAKPADKQYEFAVFKKHCTQCHNSVADPERPGKTRDEWYAIINLMEGHGLNISQSEADMIVDLLYNLRRGVEENPG